MSCINPISLDVHLRHHKIQKIEVPCGHCLNCLIKKQSQIEFLAKKELLSVYRRGESAAFVTLTYDDNHLPVNDFGFVTLRRSDVQKFIKNMRRQMEYHNVRKNFKYLYCGEYGDGSHSNSKTGVSTCRPHYHLVFLGLGSTEVKAYTRKLWKNGLCDIGELSAGGIRYLCKYMTKACPDKDVKQFRESCQIQNPFFYHSIGLGKQWIIENMQKIVEDGFTFNLNGKIQLFPKYVCQFVSNHTGVDYRRAAIEYLNRHVLPFAKVSGISYSQYDFENSFLNYKMKIINLRQNGKPVNDITLSRKYVKPKHSFDRLPSNIVQQAFDFGHYGDVVPF